MNKVEKYSAVNTKIHGMFSKLLNNEDYKKIVSLKSPREIAEFLNNNLSYKDLFIQKNILAMGEDSIERLLEEGLILQIDKLMYHLKGEVKEFLRCYYAKYEIEELKKLARLIHIDKERNKLMDSLVLLGRYKYIEKDKILKSRNLVELIRALQDTVYYPFIKNLLNRDEKENLYRFEMALDKAYFCILEEKVNRLDKEDRKAFYELYGCYIDMLNIQWIYRGKKYYSLSPEEIFNYTINRGFQFDYKQIKFLCYLKSCDDLIDRIKSTSYSFMFKGDNLQDIYMERRMNRFLYYRIKPVKQKHRLDLSLLISFIQIYEFEVKDLISMIENVRYGMDYENAKKYLIKAI